MPTVRQLPADVYPETLSRLPPLNHYSVLIASYAQGAILLCIVGQELHDHLAPGLPEQKEQ